MRAIGAGKASSEDWSDFDILEEYLPASGSSPPDDSGKSQRHSTRKTREELNFIEKQRTRRINQQIQALRSLLEASGLTTKKDKYSILHNTGEYIRQLQQSLAASELKNQQLQRTLETRPTDTALSVAETATLSSSGEYHGSLPPPAAIIPSEIDPASYDSADFASNVDYQNLFLNASIAMAVANVDGQFMDCNVSFSRVSGFTRSDIKRVSMFNLTPPEEMNHLFTIVGGMLSEPCNSGKHFWKRCRFRRGESHCFVSMWLVRRPTGDPAYFQCAIVPLEDIPSTIVPAVGGSGGAGTTGVGVGGPSRGAGATPARVPTEADLRLTMPGR